MEEKSVKNVEGSQIFQTSDSINLHSSNSSSLTSLEKAESHEEKILYLSVGLFDEGFLQFLENRQFSDITLILPNQRKYQAHKIILSASAYFDNLLGRLSKDETKLELNNIPYADQFEIILKYLYEGKVEFTIENVAPILAMSKFYLVDELKESSIEFLLSCMNKETVLLILEKIFPLADEVISEVISKGLELCAKFFSNLVEKSGVSIFNFFPSKYLIRLTRRNNLVVSSEMLVFNVVNEYIRSHSSELSPEEINVLFETIRFPFLSFEELNELSKNSLVPQYLLHEALMARVNKQDEKKTENPVPIITRPRESSGGNASRLMPRAAFSKTFEYTSDFDKNGIMWYIGTKEGKEPWSNPAIRGRVRISSSSVQKGDVVSVLEYEPGKQFWTMDVPSSWIQISLSSTKTVIPNYYTIRHGGKFPSDALRNWTFQGSNDGNNWSILKRHVNDTSLNSGYATASWPIDCTKSYRYFRILQTGRNNNGNNFLCLSGFEIYGDLYENTK